MAGRPAGGCCARLVQADEVSRLRAEPPREQQDGAAVGGGDAGAGAGRVAVALGLRVPAQADQVGRRHGSDGRRCGGADALSEVEFAGGRSAKLAPPNPSVKYVRGFAVDRTLAGADAPALTSARACWSAPATSAFHV
eukprot:scaffold30854_cov73-Isochrysis_galbana.AAC.1